MNLVYAVEGKQNVGNLKSPHCWCREFWSSVTLVLFSC